MAFAGKKTASLVLCYRGVIQIRIGQDSFYVPHKHGMLIPPEQAYSLGTQRAAEVHWLEFSPMHVKIAGLLPSGYVVRGSPLLRGIANRLSPEALPVLDREAACRLAMVALDEISRLQKQDMRLPGGHDPRLCTVMDHLLNAPGDKRGMDALAHDFGTSARTLSRLFVTETGLGFNQWRQRARFMFALEHITDGISSKQIAQKLGYSTPSAFIAAFKAHFGVPPSAFRG